MTVEVAGGSTAPALDAGDWLIARVGGVRAAPHLRGGGAGARRPRRSLLLKRVVALPGETVELRDGAVHIDGRAILEEDKEIHLRPRSSALTWPDRDAYYLVLGTPRREHRQSRSRAVPAQACRATKTRAAVAQLYAVAHGSVRREARCHAVAPVT
ncbi:MAG: S26 family signal peptidase [Dehalococcoidia bacterium]